MSDFHLQVQMRPSSSVRDGSSIKELEMQWVDVSGIY